jgi:outer membrane protein assembly factor BamB
MTTTRSRHTLVVAVILVIVIMGTALLLTFTGGTPAKFTASEVWSTSMPNMQSMKIIDLTGDGQNDLFAQNDTTFAVLDASGKVLQEEHFDTPLATTMGDVTGDGVEDVAVFAPLAGQRQVLLYSQNERLWANPIESISDPARVAVLRFPERTLIVAGDDRGLLVALDTQGTEVWRSQLSSGDAIRGLDDARINGKAYLAAANHNGAVALYDEQGQTLWTYNTGVLRRLRAYDLNGDGTSEIILGGEYGDLVVLSAATGEVLWQKSLGQAVTEIREAELNGEPSAREFVAGGKDGGVWAFSRDGQQLWSSNVDDKVTEIAGIDVDRDGAVEVIIGDESGGVNLFAGRTGDRFGLGSRPSAIMRIDAEKLGDGRRVVVADGGEVHVEALEKENAPFFYSPLIVGGVLSAAILIVAWIIMQLPPKPAQRLALEDQSAEGLQSQRRMLYENIADVERMKQAGEMPPAAYETRLRELRAELSANEAALKKLGVKIEAITFKCPNCGGTLPLGVDKCSYCGQVVIA